ncbi:MAG: hypothetical protein JXQ96_11120 [Cyclobacteriaceae bacterium]
MILLLSAPAYSQVLIPGDYTRDYHRLLELKNQGFAESISIEQSILSSIGSDSTLHWNLWGDNYDLNIDANDDFFVALDPSVSMVYNSKMPKGINDGAVWSGKGMNSSVTAGFTLKKGMFHMTLAPVLFYAQNKSFFIPENNLGKSNFSYPFEGRIDWVERYGSQSFASFHPGQSEVRLIHKKFTVGVSSQNMTWGPATNNPIIMSTNAPGFPHFDIGTAESITTKIGEVDFRAILGLLNESEYFDEDEANNKRYITGFTLGYKPNFIEGLSLGLHRIRYRTWFDGDLKFKDIIGSVWGWSGQQTENVGGRLLNDAYDNLMSVSMDWRFVEQGFRSYIEFSRNDFSGSITNFLRDPDHSRAFTIGLVKTIDLSNGNIIKFNYEHTNLSNGILTHSVFPLHYYIHGFVKQGYTNNGQIVGSSNGPGTNSDFVDLNYYFKKGMIGVNLQRLRYNDDYYFLQFEKGNRLPAQYDWSLGWSAVKFYERFSLNVKYLYSPRQSWYYIDELDTFNHRLEVRASYKLID